MVLISDSFLVVICLLVDFVGLLCVYVTSAACQSVLGEDPSSVVYVMFFPFLFFPRFKSLLWESFESLKTDHKTH